MYIYAFRFYYSCSAIASPTESTDDGSTGLPYVLVTVSVVIVLFAAIVLIIIFVVLVMMYRKKSRKFDIR